jgi:hypothetical protein
VTTRLRRSARSARIVFRVRASCESTRCEIGKRVPSVRSRACGSFRLQKSTSGAWHRAPAGEEPTEAAASSPSSLQRRAKERSEAGLGRQSPRNGGGSAFEVAAQAAIERTLVDGRRFEPTKPSLLTRGRWKRFWWRHGVSAPGRRDRERQRQVLPPRSRLTRPRRRGAGRRGPSIERPRRNARRPHPPSDDEGSVVDACRS